MSQVFRLYPLLIGGNNKIIADHSIKSEKVFIVVNPHMTNYRRPI